MGKVFLMQFLTLSLFALYTGFCFCDGFKLHIMRKLIWFVAFLIIGICVLKTKNEFDLTLILPVPIILAILLCAYEKIKSKKKA